MLQAIGLLKISHFAHKWLGNYNPRAMHLAHKDTDTKGFIPSLLNITAHFS